MARRRRLSEADYRLDATLVGAVIELTRALSTRHPGLAALDSATSLLIDAGHQLVRQADSVAVKAAAEPSE